MAGEKTNTYSVDERTIRQELIPEFLRLGYCVMTGASDFSVMQGSVARMLRGEESLTATCRFTLVEGDPLERRVYEAVLPESSQLAGVLSDYLKK